MIARLEEIDAIGRHQIHDTMFFREAAGPCTGKHIFERLGLSNSFKWIPENRFNDFESAERYLSIRFNPVSKILTKFWLKDGGSARPDFFLQVPVLF